MNAQSSIARDHTRPRRDPRRRRRRPERAAGNRTRCSLGSEAHADAGDRAPCARPHRPSPVPHSPPDGRHKRAAALGCGQLPLRSPRAADWRPDSRPRARQAAVTRPSSPHRGSMPTCRRPTALHGNADSAPDQPSNGAQGGGQGSTPSPLARSAPLSRLQQRSCGPSWRPEPPASPSTGPPAARSAAHRPARGDAQGPPASPRHPRSVSGPPLRRGEPYGGAPVCAEFQQGEGWYLVEASNRLSEVFGSEWDHNIGRSFTLNKRLRVNLTEQQRDVLSCLSDVAELARIAEHIVDSCFPKSAAYQQAEARFLARALSNRRRESRALGYLQRADRTLGSDATADELAATAVKLVVADANEELPFEPGVRVDVPALESTIKELCGRHPTAARSSRLERCGPPWTKEGRSDTRSGGDISRSYRARSGGDDRAPRGCPRSRPWASSTSPSSRASSASRSRTCTNSASSIEAMRSATCRSTRTAACSSSSSSTPATSEPPRC